MLAEHKESNKSKLDQMLTKYKDAQRCYLEYLLTQIRDDGYIPAARDYALYQADWFRDSSFVAIRLLEAYDRRFYVDNEKLADAASRIIRRNCIEIEKYIDSIKGALNCRLDDENFFRLSNHIPARFGERGLFANDSERLGEKRSLLMQHDTLPLVLLSLKKKDESIGLDTEDKAFLDRNARVFAEYLGKIYITESANIWEKYSEFIHSYDVASVYAAFRALSTFAKDGIITSIDTSFISRMEYGLYYSGPLGFLRDNFIRNDILYSSMKKFEAQPLFEMGVDASAIYIFTDFGIDEKIIGSAVNGTIAKINLELFKDKRLPWRFIGDRYFGGGPWVLLGEKYAAYYAKHGKLNEAMAIQDYIIDRFGTDLPEQDDCCRQYENMDEGGELAYNNGRPIQFLAWAYAEGIGALGAIINALENAGQLRR